LATDAEMTVASRERERERRESEREFFVKRIEEVERSKCCFVTSSPLGYGKCLKYIKKLIKL